MKRLLVLAALAVGCTTDTEAQWNWKVRGTQTAVARTRTAAALTRTPTKTATPIPSRTFTGVFTLTPTATPLPPTASRTPTPTPAPVLPTPTVSQVPSVTVPPALTPTPTAAPTLTPTPLDAPVIATEANPDGTVMIGWSAVPGAGFYEIERAPALSGPWAVVGVTIGTAWTDPVSNVLPETEYYYRVKPFAGELVDSNVAEATTEGTAPLTIAGAGLVVAALAYGAYRLFRNRNGGTA